MNFKFKIVFGGIALLACNAANATADLDGVTIEKLNINKELGNYVFVRTSTAPTIIGCQTDGNWNLVLELANPIDDKIYAGLLAAQASKRTVRLVGTGTCSSWGIEYLKNFTIN